MTRIPRGDLLQTLARVQPGLSASDLFEQSAAFVFSEGWLMTFNGEIACRTKTTLPKDFAGAVRAKPLYDALGAIPDDEVELDLSDPAVFQVAGTAGKRKWFRVRMEADILLPIEQVESPAKDDWRDLPEDFTQALKTVLPAASKNEQEFVAACVHATPKYLECCDRMQLCRYRLPMPCGGEFLFRAKSARHLVEFDMARFGETEKWVHFRNAAVIFSCSRHLDLPPNLDAAFEFRGESLKLSKEAAVGAALGAVFTSADKTDDKVTVELRPGRMEVIGRGQFGESSYPVETSYAGPPGSFRISPTAFAEMVKTHDLAEYGKDAQGRDRLRIEGERWVYLIAVGAAGEADKKRRGRKALEPEPVPVPDDADDSAYATEDLQDE